MSLARSSPHVPTDHGARPGRALRRRTVAALLGLGSAAAFGAGVLAYGAHDAYDAPGAHRPHHGAPDERDAPSARRPPVLRVTLRSEERREVVACGAARCPAAAGHAAWPVRGSVHRTRTLTLVWTPR